MISLTLCIVFTRIQAARTDLPRRKFLELLNSDQSDIQKYHCIRRPFSLNDGQSRQSVWPQIPEGTCCLIKLIYHTWCRTKIHTLSLVLLSVLMRDSTRDRKRVGSSDTREMRSKIWEIKKYINWKYPEVEKNEKKGMVVCSKRNLELCDSTHAAREGNYSYTNQTGNGLHHSLLISFLARTLSGFQILNNARFSIRIGPLET